jgi:hypothetical protein
MRIRAVLAAGFVAIAVGLALVLIDSERRQAGSNFVPEFAEVLTIDGTGSHCQADQVIPADAATLRLLIGTYGGPTPEIGVTVRSGGETIASAELPAGRSEGHILIPVGPFEERREDAEVCVEVRGTGDDRRTVLYGTLGQVRFEWLREGRESWLELIPTVAHRFGLGKPFLSGAWVLWLAAGLLALAWLLALRLVVRELSR